MAFPKISIVTPSYNQGQYLEETILSVIGQNYPNLEYVIIDGGSTDNSVEIIKKYEKHLTYWISEKDNGMYHAIQNGFEKTSGDIMAWINSDDKYHPKSLFVVAEIFSNYPKVEWLQGLPSLIDETGRVVSLPGFRKWSKYNYLLAEYEWIQQESCFWKRSLWERSGSTLDTSLKYAGDFELWLRFFNTAELYSVNTIIGAFRGRNKNQFSVEMLGDYRKEVNVLLAKRLTNLSKEEKIQLQKLMRYIKIYGRIPILKSRLYKNHINNFKYPPKIFFDRMSQSFKMELLDLK